MIRQFRDLLIDRIGEDRAQIPIYSIPVSFEFTDSFDGKMDMTKMRQHQLIWKKTEKTTTTVPAMPVLAGGEAASDEEASCGVASDMDLEDILFKNHTKKNK